MGRGLLAIIFASGCCAQIGAQDGVRVALTTKVSQAFAHAYKGASASPWAHSGSPPASSKWKQAAKAKYQATLKAATGYEKLNSLDKRFRNVAIAVAMDWELFIANQYAVLQAAYESTHPWRTGRIVRKNWTEAQGNRFAAITSSVGDVLLLELTKAAMRIGTTPLAWPDFPHALWFGQFQEIVAEQGLTHKDWQFYVCDAKRNPIILMHNSTNPDVHWIPQLCWITLPLDMATFMGDVLSGESKARWADYEQRGIALWDEYHTVHSPVVHEILAQLGAGMSNGGKLSDGFRQKMERKPPSHSPLLDEMIEQSQAAVRSAIRDYDSIQGSLTAGTYEEVRSVYLSVGIGSNRTIPPAPTCVHGSIASQSATVHI